MVRYAAATQTAKEGEALDVRRGTEVVCHTGCDICHSRSRSLLSNVTPTLRGRCFVRGGRAGTALGQGAVLLALVAGGSRCDFRHGYGQ
jgi:hypothetical protein